MGTMLIKTKNANNKRMMRTILPISFVVITLLFSNAGKVAAAGGQPILEVKSVTKLFIIQ